MSKCVRKGITLKRIFKISALILAFMHLTTLIYPMIPHWIISLALSAVLICGLSLMSSGFKKATIIFLVFGAVILLVTKQPLAE